LYNKIAVYLNEQAQTSIGMSFKQIITLIILLCTFGNPSHGFGFDVKDSLLISKYHGRALKICYSKPDSAVYYAYQALSLSRIAQKPFYISRSYNIIGIYHDIVNQWDSALFYYEISLDYARKSGSRALEASIINNIGLIYWNRDLGDSAILYYDQSLKIFEAEGIDQGVANNLSNISLILRDLEREEEALDYQKRALALRMKINDAYGIGVSYVNIGLLYSALNQPDSAKIYLSNGIDIKRRNKDRHGLALAYSNYATLWKDEQIWDSARYYYRKSIRLHQALKNNKSYASDCRAISDVFYQIHAFDSALVYGHLAEKVFSQLEDTKMLEGTELRLAKSYEKLGQLKKAAAYYHQSRLHFQESYRLERDESIAEINKKLENTLQEKELAEQKALSAENELKLQNRSYIIIGVSILAVFGITLLFIVYRQQRYKNKQLKEENALKDKLAEVKVINQVNEERLRISQDLHDNIGSNLTFIMSSIDNLLLGIKKSPEKVEPVLNTIYGFTKQSITELRDTIWALNRERISETDFRERLMHLVGTLNGNMDGAAIFLDWDEHVQFNFKPVQGVELYRIIQESINNAIKHSGMSRFDIEVRRKQSQIQMRLIDNGKGFDLNEVIGGNGLKNMQQRAEKAGIKFNLISKPEQGTQVILGFDIQEK
jgi:signal transduction histidine kinase